MDGLMPSGMRTTNGEDLEKFGLPGPSQIRTNLSKTRKTKTLLNAVRKFQNDNGIKSNVMAPALKLLDMHDIRRTDCYEVMIGDASSLLLERLRALGAEKTPEATARLEAQLEKCFRMYAIPQIRPIVLETMTQIPKLSDSYVELVVADPALYEDSSVHVKQQVWLRHEDLYVDAIKPVIQAYVKAKQAVLCSIDPSPTNFFSSETTKTRRQWEHIQTLVTMFGEFEPLYLKLMSMIREFFLESGDLIYCSMKLEIIMAAHDASIEIVKNDVSHELAWCLDMCMRDKNVDAQQTNRLKNILEGCKKHSNEVIGEMSMVAADPHVTHFLCTHVLRVMRDQCNHIPREQQGLQLCVRVIFLGCAAHRIVQTQEVPDQMVDAIFFTKFLPGFAALIMEDVMRSEYAKHGGMEEESERAGLYSGPSETVLAFLRAEPVAALLWIHYTVDLLPKRSLDIRGMMRYLRVVPILKDQMAVRSPWSHLLTHRLLTAPLIETLINELEVVGIIVERLFLGSLKVDLSLKYQLLRLINQLYRILHPTIGVAVMEHITPLAIGDCSDAERYQADYSRTLAKVTRKEEERPVFATPGVPQTPARIAATPSHAI